MSKCVLCKHIRIAEIEDGAYIYVCDKNNDVDSVSRQCEDFEDRHISHE